jgi:predicted HicB family RNase H-like nuclease
MSQIENRTRTYSYTFPLRPAKSIKQEALKRAIEEGVSLNHFISICVAEKLSRMESREEQLLTAHEAIRRKILRH